MWVLKVMLGFANKLPPLRIVYRLFFSGSYRNHLFFIWSFQRLFSLPHCRRSAELLNYVGISLPWCSNILMKVKVILIF